LRFVCLLTLWPDAKFVATGGLDKESGAEGSVQFQVLTNKPAGESRLVASAATVQGGKGTWTDADKPISYTTAIVVNEGSVAAPTHRVGVRGVPQDFPGGALLHENCASR
jgi:hypothetical protein